jgi:hypothetical protein
MSTARVVAIESRRWWRSRDKAQAACPKQVECRFRIAEAQNEIEVVVTSRLSADERIGAPPSVHPNLQTSVVEGRENFGRLVGSHQPRMPDLEPPHDASG